MTDCAFRPSVNSLLEELSGSMPVAVENRKRGAPKSLSLSLRKYALGTRKRRPLTDVIPVDEKHKQSIFPYCAG